MKYNGCTCKLVFNQYVGRYWWEITFPDGKTDITLYEQIALMLCDGRLKRAS